VEKAEETGTVEHGFHTAGCILALDHKAGRQLMQELIIVYAISERRCEAINLLFSMSLLLSS